MFVLLSVEAVFVFVLLVSDVGLADARDRFFGLGLGCWSLILRFLIEMASSSVSLWFCDYCGVKNVLRA